MPIGQKAVDYFARRDVKILRSYDHVAEHANIYLGMDIAELVISCTYQAP